MRLKSAESYQLSSHKEASRPLHGRRGNTLAFARTLVVKQMKHLSKVRLLKCLSREPRVGLSRFRSKTNASVLKQMSPFQIASCDVRCRRLHSTPDSRNITFQAKSESESEAEMTPGSSDEAEESGSDWAIWDWDGAQHGTEPFCGANAPWLKNQQDSRTLPEEANYCHQVATPIFSTNKFRNGRWPLTCIICSFRTRSRQGAMIAFFRLCTWWRGELWKQVVVRVSQQRGCF